VSKSEFPTSVLGFYWHFLKQKKVAFWGIILCVAFSSLREGFSPYFIKLIIDGVQQASLVESRLTEFPYVPYYILTPLVLYLIIQFLNEWLQVAVDAITRQLIPWLKAQMRQTLFERAQEHSPRYFQDNFSGVIGSRISQIAMITDTMRHIFIWDLLSPFCRLLFIIGIMFYENYIYGSFIVIWLIIFFSIILAMMPKISKSSEDFAHDQNKVNGFLIDSLSNIFSVKYYARSNHEMTALLKIMDNERHKDKKLQWNLLVQRIFMRNSTTIVIGIMLFLMVYGWYQGQVTAGLFAMTMMLSLQLGYSANSMGSGIMTSFSQFGQLREALNLINEPIEINNLKNSQKLITSKGALSFEKLDFEYKNQDTIFNDFNLEIPAQQKIGVVGPSGAGKSTLVSLLLRFYDLKSGTIKIDDQDISKITQNSLRHSVAVIPQDTSLFHRTLMDNIRYGRLDASDEDVIEAAKRAHAHEFIIELPLGYDTMVGERGMKLSGGQRQRIAIARAILKGAPILILDEATSALDSESERLIQDSLKTLMEGKTVIAIAHRLSTIAHLDRFIVMDHGRIVQDGTHEELKKQDGLYAKLWNMQSGGFLGE